MEAPALAKWERFGSHRCLVIEFSGKLSIDEARAKMAAIHRELEGVEEPIHMIWDAANMTAYEGEARKHWQDGLTQVKSRIRAIHLVSSSAVIRMGASVVGMFAGFQIKSWPTRTAIKIEN